MSSLLPDSSLMEDDRAVAPLIGFILLFGMLTIAYAGYQAEIVPQQNQGVEFDHSQDVQSDLQDLHASLLDIRAVSDNQEIREHRPVRVRLGTQYPTRLITINPPPPQGSLFTQNEGTISIDNAEVDGTFTGNPEQNLLETDHQTQLLVYEPGYHEYRNAPTTVFEHSLLYNQFDGASLATTDQRLIRGGSNTINIVLFEGNVSESGLQTTLDPETLDGPTAQVPIKATNGDVFNITIPTKSPEIWADEEVIGESFDEGASNARAEVTGENEVTIVLDDDIDVSWTLQMTKVGYDGGEKDDVFSSIEKFEPDSEDIESVIGPSVEVGDEHLEVIAGEQIDLADDVEGEITSVGNEDLIQSGTPIQIIKYDVVGPDGETHIEDEVYADFDPDTSNRTINFSDIPEIAIDDDPIDTTGWEEGNHTISVYAQDASGRTTHNEEIGNITVEIIEEETLDLAIRVDDLTHVRDDNTAFLTSVSITDESEDFERIEVVHQSTDNPWAEEVETISSPRGSVLYEEGGTAEDNYEITVRVIHSEDGEDVIADERTISAVADASNPITEDVSLPSSPQLDESEILDRSNPWDGARYRISYEVDQTGAYDETQLFLISTEGGGFDDDTEIDEAATIDLETDGYDEEFKIAILVIDDDGVVVDARIELDTAEETSAGNTEIASSSAQEPDLPGNSPDSELAFELEKDGPSDVTIVGIGFEETSTDATVIDASDQGFAAGDTFVRTDTDTVLRSDSIGLGTGEMDVTDETFAQWENPEFMLTQFRDDNGDQVGMAGETVTIRLYFADGSSRSYELTG